MRFLFAPVHTGVKIALSTTVSQALCWKRFPGGAVMGSYRAGEALERLAVRSDDGLQCGL